MPEIYMSILEWAGYYAVGVMILWLINAFAAGYSGGEASKSDFMDSLLWPVSLAATIGMLVRVAVNQINKK